MSRAYEMTVTINAHDPDHQGSIIKACKEEWSFDNIDEIDNGELLLFGQDSLTGGETEQEFANRLAKRIWKANRGGCQITVRATYMENLPCEEYTFAASQYRKPRAKKQKRRT